MSFFGRGVARAMRNWRRVGVAALGAVLLPCCWGQGEAGPPAHILASQRGAKLYPIAGTVTDFVTGEPVLRATVSLVDEEDRETIASAETTDGGRFTLPPMPAAKYGLRVARRGYLTSYYNEHDEFSSAIVTGEGQDTEHIPFLLKPAAVVRGTVTDDAGEPVEHAQVILMRKSRGGGLGEHLTRSISGVTDDTGGFEFWNLVPGTYLLAVKATPWYALHRPMNGASAEEASAAAALDVAYPVTFYDGTTEEDAATPITVAAGDRPELNVGLHAVPAIHLLVHTGETEAAGRRYVDTPMLRQTVFGEDETVAPGGMQPGPPGSGTVEMEGLAPGHYSVMQGNPPRITEMDASGSGSQAVDTANGEPTVVVDVKAQMTDGSALPQPLNLSLTAAGSVQKEIAAGMAGPGHLRFDSVPAGTWTLVARVSNLALAVVGLHYGTGTLAGSRFAVKTQPLSLTAVLAQGVTRVNGFALKDGKAMAGAMIVLVPKDPAANWAMFRRDQSDSDGSFALRDVVPGQYTAVAIEDGWELDWARAEVIGRYLLRGTAVTVSSQSGKLVQLAAPVTVQPR